MKIIQLIANWYYTPDGEDYESYNIGENGVLEIIEHLPQGEGDKWYYDIHFETGEKTRTFNPNFVEFGPSL